MKIKTRSEFAKTFPEQYRKIIRSGGLAKARLDKILPGNRSWTLESCLVDAKLFTTKQAWIKKSGGAYQAARKNGWLIMCCLHMVDGNRYAGYWTIINCTKDAKRFNSKKEWAKNSSGAYSFASKNGWIDECCTHMEVIRRLWNLEDCKKEATKYKSIGEWCNGQQSSYQAARKNGWVVECTRHMVKTRGKWTPETCLNVALKYKKIKDWKKNCQGSYSAACKNGWLDLCNKHMEVIVGKWTLSAIKKEALKYKTRSEWLTKSAGSYSAARSKGCLTSCSPHMENGRIEKGGWTKEKCIQSAAKFDLKSKWKLKFPGAARAALVNGWETDCCAHMSGGKARVK